MAGRDSLLDSVSGVRKVGTQPFGYLVLLVVFTGGALLLWSWIYADDVLTSLSASVIHQAKAQLHAELDGFFAPIEDQVVTIRDWGRRGLIEIGDADGAERLDHLQQLLEPLVDPVAQVSSLLIIRDDRKAYALSRDLEEGGAGPAGDGPRWVSRALVDLQTPDGRRYDPLERPWYVAAIHHAEGGPVWTRPYLFGGGGGFEPQPGMTVSARWRRGPHTYVVAVDVLLAEVSRLTAGAAVSEHGRALVLTQGGTVIGFPNGPPKGGSPLPFPMPVRDLEERAIADAAESWSVSGLGTRAFRSKGEAGVAWAGFEPYALGAEHELWLGAVVPEEDLLGPLVQERRGIYFVTGLALALAIGLSVLLRRAFKKGVRDAVQRLGQYTLEERLGSGGMGTVYKACHALLRRPTAIKLLAPAFMRDEVALERFEREVQITARLTHPNTIAIYDYGRTPDGVFYYAMEYLPGVDLQRLVDATGPMPPARVVFILRQICGSLAEAHAEGLIHRDIKPANVILTERGRQHDVAKVLDFGLAKDIGTVDSALTSPDTVVGTPLYMAPEALTDRTAVGPASDVYAVGAVAYFLLTGTVVFDGDTPMAVWTQHTHDEPEPPSARMSEPLCDKLEALVLSCLAKDPKDRPRSAEILDGDLSGCLGMERWTEADARGWWAEHGGHLGLVVGALAPSEAATQVSADLRDRR